jgi:hypothetical protein
MSIYKNVLYKYKKYYGTEMINWKRYKYSYKGKARKDKVFPEE